MKQALREDMARFGGKTVAVLLFNRGFHAVLAYRVAAKLLERRVPLAPWLLTRLIQVLYGIDIDPRAKIGGGCRILHGVGLVVAQEVRIGPGVTIYHGVTLGITGGAKDGVPVVGRGCVLGAGAKVLGPVQIGDNVNVGANAVVLQDVPSGCDAVGIPARVIKR
ncbi:serine acetyltransferase [Nocardioides sp. dk4132]|nr:serine acetyltransferase [Nocardioides sp. dk4132]QGA09826.1 serine acetyltransferase [Nocardioides sp. dk884]